MKVNKGFVRKAICVVCVLVMLLSLFAGAISASAAEVEMPSIARWINDLAISEDGVFLTDVWAVDETNVSDKKFVLLGQDGMEVMRVANYPDDIAEEDNTPCEKCNFSASLSVPEGVSGDFLVTLASEYSLYSFVISESNNYTYEAEIYPGIYSISDIEGSSEVLGSLVLTGGSGMYVMGSEYSASFELTEVDSEETEPVPTDGDVAGEFDEEMDKESDKKKDTKSELLADTVGLAVGFVLLLLIYFIIKFKRG